MELVGLHSYNLSVSFDVFIYFRCDNTQSRYIIVGQPHGFKEVGQHCVSLTYLGST